jgi:hypothetical protein
MKHVIVATAAAVILSGAASARDSGVETAMGPTSAAHFPSGQPRGNPAPDCSLPYDQCPEDHRAPKHRYKTPKHPRHGHSRDY